MDPNLLADTLHAWLAAHHGTLPRALDGKYVRDLIRKRSIEPHYPAAAVWA